MSKSTFVIKHTNIKRHAHICHKLEDKSDQMVIHFIKYEMVHTQWLYKASGMIAVFSSVACCPILSNQHCLNTLETFCPSKRI